MKNINELTKEAHQIAVEHGWHEKKLTNEHYSMLMCCELAEAVEADRASKHANVKLYQNDIDYAVHDLRMHGAEFDAYMKGRYEDYIKDTVEDELADLVIRILDFCGLYKLDLQHAKGENDKDGFLEFWKENVVGFPVTCYWRIVMITDVTTIPSDKQKESLLRTIVDDVDAWCEVHNIDLEWYVKEKMKYNKLREYKHGKEY